MGAIVTRLKAGGSWDPMIGRFTWWVLDGPPIMEPLLPPVLESSLPSIEQFGYACSLFRNCTFIYDDDALKKVINWGNTMRQKSESLLSCRSLRNPTIDLTLIDYIFGDLGGFTVNH